MELIKTALGASGVPTTIRLRTLVDAARESTEAHILSFFARASVFPEGRAIEFLSEKYGFRFSPTYLHLHSAGVYDPCVLYASMRDHTDDLLRFQQGMAFRERVRHHEWVAVGESIKFFVGMRDSRRPPPLSDDFTLGCRDILKQVPEAPDRLSDLLSSGQYILHECESVAGGLVNCDSDHTSTASLTDFFRWLIRAGMYTLQIPDCIGTAFVFSSGAIGSALRLMAPSVNFKEPASPISVVPIASSITTDVKREHALRERPLRIPQALSSHDVEWPEKPLERTRWTRPPSPLPSRGERCGLAALCVFYGTTIYLPDTIHSYSPVAPWYGDAYVEADESRRSACAIPLLHFVGERPSVIAVMQFECGRHDAFRPRAIQFLSQLVQIAAHFVPAHRFGRASHD